VSTRFDACDVALIGTHLIERHFLYFFTALSLFYFYVLGAYSGIFAAASVAVHTAAIGVTFHRDMLGHTELCMHISDCFAESTEMFLCMLRLTRPSR
jgi:hypothetical protein